MENSAAKNCALCGTQFKRRAGVTAYGYDRRILSSKVRSRFVGYANVTLREAMLQMNPNQVLNGTYICSSCGVCVEQSFRKVVAQIVTVTTDGKPETATAHKKPTFSRRRKRLHSARPHVLGERKSAIFKSIYNSFMKGMYLPLYRKVWSTGRAAQKAFAVFVQSVVRSEMRTFLLNKSEDNQFLQFDGTCRDLECFDWLPLVTGLGIRLPVLKAVMLGSLPKQKSTTTDDEKLTSAMRLGMMMSIPLFSHKPVTLKLIQAVNAIEMWKCGVSNKLFRCFSRLGVCQSFSAVRKTVDLIVSPLDLISEERENQQQVDVSSNVNQMELDEDQQHCQSKNVSGSSAQPDDETSLIPVNVGSSQRCVCHVLTDCNNDEIQSFNNKTWIRLCEFMATWKDLEGPFHHLASCFDATAAHSEGYHARCYLSFTDESKLSDARVVAMTSVSQNGNLPNFVRNSDAAERSHIARAGRRFKIGECFICRGQRYRYDRMTKLNTLKELHCCNSSKNGRSLPGIRAAALHRGDQMVLDSFRRHDEDRDFVLKYHDLCYLEYISGSKKVNTVLRSTGSVRIQEFNKFFGSVVDKWIIEGSEMLTLSELKKMLIIHVEQSMAVSLSNSAACYWKDELRERLKMHYGDRIAFIWVNGRRSNFVLSSTKLQQILSVADGLPASSTEELNIHTQILEASTVPRSSTNSVSGVSACNSIMPAEVKDELDDVPSDWPTVQHSTDTADELSDLLKMDIYNASDMKLANECIYCQESLESLSDLDKHLSETPNCRSQHDDINERTVNVDVDCVTAVSELPTFKCNKCLKHYETSERMIQHKKKCRAPAPQSSLLKLFNCKLCSKWFRERVQFKKHMRSHRSSERNNRSIKPNTSVISERYYRCQDCDKWLATAHRLKLHTSSHLNTPSKYSRMRSTSKCHPCSYCEMDFSRQSHLDEHMFSQHGMKAYCCAHCDKRFPGKRNLKKHMVIHENAKKSLLCEFCSLPFFRLDALKNHITMNHKDERPYVCQECNKSFAVAKSLIAHSTCHSSLKLFICEVCGKDFKTKMHLIQHVKSHTKPYCCELCNERFSLSSYLRLHLKKHKLEMNASRRYRRSKRNNLNSRSDSHSDFSSDAAVSSSTTQQQQQQQQQPCMPGDDNSPTYFDEQFQFEAVTDHTYFFADSFVECEELTIADSENVQDSEFFFASIE